MERFTINNSYLKRSTWNTLLVQKKMFNEYDVIVVGAGHTVCEAAHSATVLDPKVLLITMNMNTIAQMSCNPAMGGAKGKVVREIDALGGMSGIISDKSMIQFRMLINRKVLLCDAHVHKMVACVSQRSGVSVR